MNESLNNIFTRRSIRKFKDTPISDEDLNEILKAAIYAPSGKNLQSWRFTAVTNKDKIEALAAAARKVLGRDENYNFYKPVVLILASNDKDNSNGLADCACATENMFLAAHSLGIGSCWINQLKTICDVPEIRKILDDFEIPSNHTVWSMVSLGYPDGAPKEAVKNDSVIKIIR